MTPRLYCNSSRLVIFDHTVFKAQIAKAKNDSAKRNHVKSGRGGRNQQPSRSKSRQVDVVETKCVRIVILYTALAQTYRSIVAQIMYK